MKKIVMSALGLVVGTVLAFTAVAEEEHTVLIRDEHGKMVEVHADSKGTAVEKEGKVTYTSGDEQQPQPATATPQANGEASAAKQ